MDIIYIFIPMVIMLLSQAYIKSTYSKFVAIKSEKNLTGLDVAKRMLERNNINNISIEKTPGTLTDHFDPKKKVVRLSEEVYSGTSIASLSIAAHEVGHVIQHETKYFPIRLRGILVPVVNFSSKIGYVVFAIGIASSLFNLVYIGLGLMSMALIFQLVTLPVEFNASNRAKEALFEGGMITSSEKAGVDKMLKSAGFTYLASFFLTMMQLIRLISNISKD